MDGFLIFAAFLTFLRMGNVIVAHFCQASALFPLVWLVGFVALRPKSTDMVIAGRSVHLTTLFPGQA